MTQSLGMPSTRESRLGGLSPAHRRLSPTPAKVFKHQTNCYRGISATKYVILHRRTAGLRGEGVEPVFGAVGPQRDFPKGITGGSLSNTIRPDPGPPLSIPKRPLPAFFPTRAREAGFRERPTPRPSGAVYSEFSGHSAGPCAGGPFGRHSDFPDPGPPFHT